MESDLSGFELCSGEPGQFPKLVRSGNRLFAPGLATQQRTYEVAPADIRGQFIHENPALEPQTGRTI
jgi:hypothetical protein